MQYSILVDVADDASIADLPERITEAIVRSVTVVDGVTGVVVDQFVVGDLQAPKEP